VERIISFLKDISRFLIFTCTSHGHTKNWWIIVRDVRLLSMTQNALTTRNVRRSHRKLFRSRGRQMFVVINNSFLSRTPLCHARVARFHIDASQSISIGDHQRDSIASSGICAYSWRRCRSVGHVSTEGIRFSPVSLSDSSRRKWPARTDRQLLFIRDCPATWHRRGHDGVRTAGRDVLSILCNFLGGPELLDPI